MTTVARQITVMSSLRTPQGLQSRDDSAGRGMQSYVLSRNKDPPNGAAMVRTEQKSSTTVQQGKVTKTVRIAGKSDNSPPPPPPPARTTSTLQRTHVQVESSSKVSSSSSSSRKFSESLTMSSTGEVITSSGSSASEVKYTREGSNTNTNTGGGAATSHSRREKGGSEGDRRFRTLQSRPLNSNAPPTTSTSTDATAGGASGGGMSSTAGTKKMHSRFSTSQPQLHRIDHQSTAIVKPNDRIKKSMFDTDDTDEKDGNWGEDYGSGYIPTLMKISHGEIQKHAVAVTTPIVPPSSAAVARRNRAGSDPNLLDTRSGSSTTAMTSDPVTQGSKVTKVEHDQQREESPASRERSSSLVSSTGSSSNEATAFQTTPIARAYREYLIEKMDKERQAMRFSPSPPTSASNGETSTPTTSNQQQHVLIPPPPEFQQQQEGASNILSPSELKGITSAQLQGMDVPDRACLPRILPPPGMMADHINSATASITTTDAGKHEQWSRTLDVNGGYPSNPFLAHSSLPQSVSRDFPPSNTATNTTGFSYGTLPRSSNSSSRPSLPESSQPWQQVQPVPKSRMLGGKSNKAQSVNNLGGGGGDFPDSTMEHDVMSSGHVKPEQHVTTDNLPIYSRSQEAPSTTTAAVGMSTGGWSQQGHAYYSSGSSSSSTSASASSSQSSSVSSPGLDTSTDFRHTNWTQQGANQAVSISPSMSTTPTGGGNARKAKPPVLPKPASRKDVTSTPNMGAQERSTSDPSSLKYGQAEPQPNQRGSSSSSSSSPSPLPLTPFPTTVSSFNTETMQLHQPPYNQSVQYGRSQKHRYYPGIAQQSTSLLEIQEADEIEEREARRMSTNEVKLFDYVSLHSSLLPKRVQISNGFCSDSTEVTISQGEHFDLHFVSELKSALVTDPSGVRYSVPLNSVTKFSIVYDPFDVEKVALSGFQFQTAGIIMNLRSPPVVVAATLTHDGGSAESSVDAGEILVVEAVKNVFHGRLLKVFSLKHSTVKYLDENCMGGFTTNPEMIKMTLSEVYERSVPLPQKVFLTPGGIIPLLTTTRQCNLPVLRQFRMAKSVVATPCTSTDTSNNPLPNGRSQAISISLDLDVEVTEVGLSESQFEELRKRTQALLTGFDRITVTHYADMPTLASHAAQSRLFSDVDPKLEQYGMEIVTPNCITPLQKKCRNPPISARNDKATPSDTEKMQSRLQAMESKYEKLEVKVADMNEYIQQVASKVDQIHTYLRKAQDTMTKHKKMLREEAEEEQRKKKSDASTSSSSTRSSLGSFSGSQQLQPERRSVSRTHSDETSRHSSAGTGGVVTAKSIPTASGSQTSSQQTNTNRLSHAHKSESIDCGSLDNDEVFPMRSRSSSTGKPPVMPKPKNLKRNTNSTLMQKLKAIKVTGKGKASVKKDDRTSKNPLPASMPDASAPAAAKKETQTESNRESTLIQSLPASLRDSIDFTSNEAIDVKEFLIETDTLTKPTPKPRPKKPTHNETTPTTTLPTTTTTTTGHTPSAQSPPIPKSGEADIDDIGDDLTDWCLQVEDELTQLYNESMSSI